MVVLSPLSTPKAQHMATADGLIDLGTQGGAAAAGAEPVVGCGVKATAAAIPGGFRQLFLLSAAYGISQVSDNGSHTLSPR
jgi:hypothetical protein